MKQDHAYIVIEVLRCNSDTKLTGYPDCKPLKMMKLKDGSSTESVAIEKLQADGADLNLYDEDEKGDSIATFCRLKKIAMKIINQKIDFTTFNEYAVRNNELFVPSVPMGFPSYSDTGYRFRYNYF